MARLSLALSLLIAAAVAARAQSARAAPGEQCYDVSWNTLMRSGKSYGGGMWGALKAADGKSVGLVVPTSSALKAVAPANISIAALGRGAKMAKGFKLAAAVSNAPDIPTVHEAGGKYYVLNHFEYPQPSTVYISELAPPDAKGTLRIADTRPVPDAANGGLWFMCSGSVTPWGTHLNGEEYPPDCRSYEELFLPCKVGPEAAADMCGLPGDDGPYIAEFGRYFGFYGNATREGLGAVDFFTNKAAHTQFTKLFSCYNYGASPEIRVLPGGKTAVTKWRTIGRISHELAYVMPDNRTVYTTDDNPNGVFLKFVADRPGDLSKGTLYAAKFGGQSANAKGNPTWTVSWIELGHGDQSSLDKLAADPSFKFSAMFDTAAPKGKPPACPPGFDMVNTASSAYTAKLADGTQVFAECLRVKKGMQTAAAFLESRRVAAARGATTQFEKQEGFTFDPATRRAYFSVSRIAKGLTNDTKHTYASGKHIKLDENKCGGIIAMDVDKGYSGTSAELILVGNKKANTDADNSCNVDAISEPDNLIVLGNNLMIQEDAHGHANNVLWAYDLTNGSLTRVLSSVRGAEVSGGWVNAIGGRAYLTMAIQHPFELESEGAAGNVTQEQAQRFSGYMGYIGPLPKSVLDKNARVRFEPIPVATGDTRNKMVATTRVCVSKAA